MAAASTPASGAGVTAAAAGPRAASSAVPASVPASEATTGAEGDLATPAQPATPRAVRRVKEAFGVEVHMMALARGDDEARRTEDHLEAAFAELDRVAALVDEVRPESDLARLNAAAGKDAVVVSAEVFGLLREAKRIAGLSRGAYDPTRAPVDALWRFTPGDGGEAPKPPSEEELATRRALVGHKDLVLDAAARTAALAREGQAVHLDGLARAHALERAAEILDERGVKDFFLSVGGDVVVRGAHGDRPWRVGVQDPRARGPFAATTVTGGAVMTTADYERFFHDGETRYHHVLDPRTGQPARGLRSVTVFADDAVTAEALSQAVFVLGAKRGLALVQRLKGVEAVLVTDENRVLVSKGLKKELTWRPPTDAP